MRNTTLLLTCLAGAALVTTSFAFNFGSHSKTAPKTQTSSTPTNSTQIKLYASKAGEKIIKIIPFNTSLAWLVKKGGMIKVGVRDHNGTVGWINQTQYQQAKTNFYQPDIQAIYVQTQPNKDGKPVINIVAYKNGKQVTPKEAKALYKNLRNQEQRQNQNREQAQINMQRTLDQNMHDMQRIFNNSWSIQFRDNWPNTHQQPNKDKNTDEIDT